MGRSSPPQERSSKLPPLQTWPVLLPPAAIRAHPPIWPTPRSRRVVTSGAPSAGASRWCDWIAVALAWVPLPAVAFDPDEFCMTVTDIVRRMNSRAGRWFNRSTCHDGVEVDCGLKTLETKRFLKADPDDMGRDRKLANSEPGTQPTATIKRGASPSTTAGASPPR